MLKFRDMTEVYAMRVREVVDEAERQRLWKLAVAAYPPYEDYQAKTDRVDSGLPCRANGLLSCSDRIYKYAKRLLSGAF